MSMRSSSRVSVLFEALESRMMLSAAPVAHHPKAHPTPAHAVHHAAHKVTTPKVTSPKVNAKPKANAAAGDPIYMNWNAQQIPGEVTSLGFAGDIELLSAQWGL